MHYRHGHRPVLMGGFWISEDEPKYLSAKMCLYNHIYCYNYSPLQHHICCYNFSPLQHHIYCYNFSPLQHHIYCYNYSPL